MSRRALAFLLIVTVLLYVGGLLAMASSVRTINRSLNAPYQRSFCLLPETGGVALPCADLKLEYAV